MIHGHGTHDSDHCKILQHKAKKFKAQNPETTSSTSGHYKNLTWSRKAEIKKEKSKKELHAFVQDQIKKGVRQEHATLNKKRSPSEMMAADAQASLKQDSSEDEDYNDMDSLVMDDAIKQETNSSDDEMV